MREEGPPNAGRTRKALKMDCVSRTRARRAEPGRGLGSLRVYLQSFLKSPGISLKGVMQRNDIIRFLFSKGHSAHRVAGTHVGSRPARLGGGM